MPTRYEDVDAKSVSDEPLLARIRTALKVQAADISRKTVQKIDTPLDPAFPTPAQRVWARAVLFNAKFEGIKAMNIILANVADLATPLADLNAWTDAQLQTEVNKVIKYLVLAQAET